MYISRWVLKIASFKIFFAWKPCSRHSADVFCTVRSLCFRRPFFPESAVGKGLLEKEKLQNRAPGHSTGHLTPFWGQSHVAGLRCLEPGHSTEGKALKLVGKSCILF